MSKPQKKGQPLKLRAAPRRPTERPAEPNPSQANASPAAEPSAYQETLPEPQQGQPSRPPQRSERSERPASQKPRPTGPTDDKRPRSKPTRDAPVYDTHQANLRLFFALKVPPEVAEQLGAAQKNLRGNWRSVRADQLHVTLAYLPGVDPAKIDALKKLGEQVAAQTAPLSLKLRGTGYFPNEGSPRVWFVKVEAEGLEELAAALRLGLTELGVDTDNLAFKAHITLARKKGAAPRLPPKIFDLGWDAGAVTLYRSHLQKTGPIYENLAMFKLRGEFRATIMSSAESTPDITADIASAPSQLDLPTDLSPEDTP
ncbi:RNA 2',3'-cyclic phosphodiesterase [Deinococcus psychrotolerans]|uniref:RNA 2',3'-cyclic phosphodiesterase n=1 Tax=Deinococcus psychrotolerans TaxID=2489213 RepID=A0A3G8YB38_9DEIO|nr:RNA 2',3'-cyclic phosphodiesterase [Deinococcus psychrotolerans]AZI42285.1 RNA 2',3'-cyclic phosphodiesterase [Deinococcus psychrotolerans]